MPSVMQTTSSMPAIRRGQDRVGGERRGHEHHADRGARGVDGGADTVSKTGTSEMFFTTAARGHAGDDLRAVLDALLRMKRSLATRQPLAR